MRYIGDESLTKAVIRLSRIFKKICSKTVNISEREALYQETVETLCLLEKEMPPSFFDIMVHLTIHFGGGTLYMRPRSREMDVPLRKVLQGAERICEELGKTRRVYS